jgi:hypothetical protein
MPRQLYPKTASRRNNYTNLKRVLLFLRIGLVVIICLVISRLGPTDQIRYTETKYVPAHHESRKEFAGSGGTTGRRRYRFTQVEVPDAWYLVVSDEKDKTYDFEITQAQYNTDYLKDRVWPNYNAF